MKDGEILRKVIDKINKNNKKQLLLPSVGAEMIGNYYYRIIFRHDFAKAFFGDGEVPDELLEQTLWDDTYEEGWIYFKGELWQYHLQQMVLEENPLQYLAKFLDEEEK